LRNNSKSGIERLYKNPKSPENTPKNAEKQQSTETKARFLHLAWQRGRFAPLPPVSYATDQVHLKHEQPQVLWIEPHVTIGTIQPTQDAASVLRVYRHNSWHVA